jgi:hypothetical protein
VLAEQESRREQSPVEASSEVMELDARKGPAGGKSGREAMFAVGNPL